MAKSITKLAHNLNSYLLSYTKQTKYLTCLFILLFSSMGWGQVTVTDPSNTTPAMSATYSSLASAIADVNNRTAISGPVTITLDASTPQTAPAGGYSITNTAITGGSVTNRFIFDGGGNIITSPTPQTSGNLNDAIFKIIGADFITIQNFTLQENAANTTTTAASNNMTEFGVALFYASATNGSQNNIIQNNIISLNRTYQNSFGIYSNVRHTASVISTTADITNVTGSNAGNKVYGNTISNVNYGIVFIGCGSTTSGLQDNGNDIGGSSAGTGNTISNSGGIGLATSAYVSLTSNNYLIYTLNQYNDNISYNNITSASGTTTGTIVLGGILKNYSTTQPTGTITTTINNNTITITNSPSVSATGSVIGINNQGLSPLLSTATISINNNIIQNCVNGSANITSGGFTGITNLSLPGTLNMNGNSIINNAITGATATSGSLTGISNTGAAGTVNINNNIIRGLASSTASGQIAGIVNSGAVVTALNINNNALGNATSGFFTTSTATSGSLFGISTSGGASTCLTTIQSNDIRGITYNLAASAANVYITSTGAVLNNTISNNTFTNLAVNTTGSVTFVNHSYTIPATGTMIINNNSIVTAFTRLAAGSITITTTNGSSVSGAINNYTNNNFSNIIVPDNASSTIIGFNNTDGGTSSTKTITGNTFNNWHGGTSGTTGTSSTINCMNFTYWNGVSSLSNNTITNITGRGAITGITMGSTVNNATSIAVSGNTINNLASIGTGGQVLAISCSNTSTTININGNTINSLSSTGASSPVGAITVFGATTTNVFQNVIYDLSTSGTTAPITLGIQVAGGTLVNVYRNKVYNLSASGGALTSSASAVSGIYLSGGTTVNTFNNLIGNLTTPNINLADAIRGINIVSTSSSTSYNVYNNSVYLTGGSAGTNFGTSGIYHTANSTASTAKLDLQNNMIFNTCTPSGTGIVTAFRRSAAATLGNYATTSNKNLFYAGTPSVNTTIMSDGTNNYQTLATFQTAVGTREVNSFTESTFTPSTFFVSTTGSNANYLQPSAGLSTPAESGGNTIAMCSPDYNGLTRPGAGASAYDIGAWEFSGAVCTAPTSLAATASSPDQNTTTISGVFTAATTAPTAYLVIRTATNLQPTPVTGTTYTAGSNAIGFIEYVGTTAGAWTSTGLTPATTYFYWVFSYNNTACSGGPVYSAATTNFSASTITCPGTSLDGLTYTTNPVSYCLNSAITPNSATLAASAGGIIYSVSPALPTGLVLSSSTGTISGTPTVVTAAADYTVTANNGCTSTTVAVNIAIVALPTTLTANAASSIAPFSFSANWAAGVSATSYFLDVATDNTFTSLVSGYSGLNVNNVLTYSVTGLSAGNIYYYRVRYTNGSCTSLNSNTITATTTAITSLATGNWNATTTWNSGTIPTCGDIITIASTHNVTINSASNVSKNLTIASGGTLTIATGDLTVGCTLNNTPLTNNGTLTVSGGTLNVNGNISCGSSSVFNQSGGNINIDGNAAGNATNSVASGIAILQFNQLNSGINLTGGTLTVVDPHANATLSNSIGLSNGTTGVQTSTSNHTTRFGDGISTDAGGNTEGFRVDPWTGSAFLSFGNIIVNGSTGTNRVLTSRYQLAAVGDVTVTTGSTLNLSPSLVTAGNVTVNSGGTLINLAGIVEALVASNTSSSLTFGPSTLAQTIGGSGTYQNLATSPTANLNSLTVNNSNATGVTLSVPLSISGTLTMTAGKINTTATNLLTLGTSTAAGTLSYTAGQIVGPFARTYATSSTSTASYDATTLFPVGDGTNYTPIHIDPVNGSGPVVMRAQAFNTNSGSAGIGMDSPLSNDRWEALATSGSSNLTSCFVGLNDAQIATGNVIAQSATAAGFYNAIAPVSTVAAGVSIRTATAIPAASYTGFFTYGSPSVANTWTGTTSNLWSTAGNWSLSSVPSATDDILISSNGTTPPLLDVNVTIPAGKSLIINGSGTLTIAPGKVLTIAGTANFGGMPVTFKSDATGTAMLGPLTGTLTGASSVTVERFIPSGKRAFRLLSPAVTTTTFISGNWQGQTHITGGASGGFDVTETNNPSMFTYNNQVTSGTGWTPIANTNATNLTAGVGYRMLVRGDRTPTNITAATTDNMNAAITLSATGTLRTGTVALNASSTPAINNTANTTTADYSLVGNPYQSAVDWNAVTKSGIDASYYAWDPNMGTSIQRGRYVVFNGTVNSVDGGVGSSNVGQFIQPGQAFFVKNTVSGTAGTLTFQEAHKATTNANVFRTNNQTESTNFASLSMQLYDPNELAIGGYPIDATKAVFGSDYTNELGLGDATKLEAAGENIAWFRNNTKLAIDAAAPVTTSDELAMKTLRLGANKNYTFKIQTTNFDTALTPYLVDNFLNTQTEIATSQAFLASFATTSNVASYSENRFKIVFQNALLNTDVFATQVGLYPNPSKGNGFYLQLPSTAQATVKLYNTLGQEIAISHNEGHYQAKQSLAAGVYHIMVTQGEKTSKLKWIVE